jgi:hypothetical protein
MIDDVANNFLKDIESSQKMIEDLQEQKKKFDEVLNLEKIKLESLRSSLFSHMIENNIKNYINDTYEVVIKNNPRTFNIKDDSNLFEYLKNIGEYEKCCKHEIKIDKRKLNQIFSDMNNCDSLPSCVEIVQGEPSLQIKSLSKVSKNTEKIKQSSTISENILNDKELNIEEFDSI